MPNPTDMPVTWGAALQALVAAVLTALTAFNVWHPTDTQTTAVWGLFTALTVIVGLVVRTKVTANSKLPKA